MAIKQGDVLRNYTKAIIESCISQAKSLSKKGQKIKKDALREAFIYDLLKHFLPPFFGVDSGIVINNKGNESKEIDLIFYDARMLPPFLENGDLSIYPIESVVAVGEVKRYLSEKDIKKSDTNAQYLLENIWKKNKWVGNKPPDLPFQCLFAFGGDKIKGLEKSNNEWIEKYIMHLVLICSVGNFSWAKVNNKWKTGNSDKNYKEIRRFMTILIENLITVSNKRWIWSLETCPDWLGPYVRLILK
ncbi:MAG: hypothetical protein PVH85_33195 [Desulfobacterales bacterium]|jgi:hypothetical protein